jgi:hypothetical protein
MLEPLKHRHFPPAVNLKDLRAGGLKKSLTPEGVSYSWRLDPRGTKWKELSVQRYELSVAFLGNHGTNELVVRW